MLKIIQIIAISQGVFILSVLLINRRAYKKTTFWLLFGCLLSVLLYIVGDDDHNLFLAEADWFLFDSSLFVTFLFLFFKYYKSAKQEFVLFDYLFFLPNITYFLIEGLEILMVEENLFIEIIELMVELTFVIYLLVILYFVISTKKIHWTIYIVIPITILLTLSLVYDIIEIFGFKQIAILNNQFFNTYLLLSIAFLFYFVTFKLLIKDKQVLPISETSKYKNSNLNPKLIEKYKTELISSMENDKLYLNNKLSIQGVSEKLNIPRQYISEILNVHMDTSFVDFINGYRIEEFVKRLEKDQYGQFTLYAIATDVGFNSKSTFNATFKKIKGLTPNNYKKKLNK